MGRLRQRAEVPADHEPRVPAPRPPPQRFARHARHGHHHRSTPWHRAASTTTSAAASPATRPTRDGWCPTSRRCCTTKPCSPASTCTRGRSPARRGTARCSTRRSTTCSATCVTQAGGFFSAEDADSEGVEGKFYVWSIDELREVAGDDADAAIEWWGVDATGQLRRPQHPVPAGAGRPAAARAVERARAACSPPRAAGAARPRRQGADRVERPVPRGPGRGGGRDRQRTMARRRRRQRRVPARQPARADRRSLATLWQSERRDRAIWPTPPTTPRSSTPSYASPRPRARPAGSPTAARRPTRLLELFWDDEHGGVFTTGSDAEKPGHPTEGSARQRHARRPTAWPPTPCCAWRRSPAKSQLSAREPRAIVRLLAAAGRPSPDGIRASARARSTSSRPGPVEVAVTGERPDLVAAVHARYLPNAVLAWGERYDSPLWEAREDGWPTSAATTRASCRRDDADNTGEPAHHCLSADQRQTNTPVSVRVKNSPSRRTISSTRSANRTISASQSSSL